MRELGFYSPDDSYLHRIHPAIKIILFGVVITLLPMFTKHWQTNLIIMSSLLVVILFAKIGKKQLLYFTPAFGLVVIAAVSWLFTNIGGNIIFEIKFGWFDYVLRDLSLQQAISMSTKAIIWVLSYIALLTTTNSRDIMAGLEKLGLPHRASIATGMTLKFWSNVIADSRNVIDAQKVRGVDFDQGSKIKMLVNRVVITSVPTIFLMLKRFRTLSFALALRAFGAPGKKTRRYNPNLKQSDFLFLIAGVMLSLTLILFDRGIF